MLRLILRSQNIKRFCHTHSKTIIDKKSNKNIRDLIIEQNKKLDEISLDIYRCLDNITNKIGNIRMVTLCLLFVEIAKSC
jgi:hypothetical protein